MKASIGPRPTWGMTVQPFDDRHSISQQTVTQCRPTNRVKGCANVQEYDDWALLKSKTALKHLSESGDLIDASRTSVKLRLFPTSLLFTRAAQTEENDGGNYR